MSIFAETIKVKVPDMSCQVCVKAMKKHFKNAVEDPSKNIRVDLVNKFVTVDIKKDFSLTNKEIKERVKNAGYKAHNIERLKSKQ